MHFAQEEEGAEWGEGWGDVTNFGEICSLWGAPDRGTLSPEAIKESNVLTAYTERSSDWDLCEECLAS